MAGSVAARSRSRRTVPSRGYGGGSSSEDEDEYANLPPLTCGYGITWEDIKRLTHKHPRRTSGRSHPRQHDASVVNRLYAWIFSAEHFDFPYPSDEEKVFLAESAGLEVKQLNYWLTNVRKRVWGPLRKERDLKLPSNADRMRTMARQRLQADPPQPHGPAASYPIMAAAAGGAHAAPTPRQAPPLAVTSAGHHHPHVSATAAGRPYPVAAGPVAAALPPSTLPFPVAGRHPAPYGPPTAAPYRPFASYPRQHDRAAASSALPPHVGAAHDTVSAVAPAFAPTQPHPYASPAPCLPPSAPLPFPPPSGPVAAATTAAPVLAPAPAGSVLSAPPPASSLPPGSAVGFALPSGLSVGRLSVLTGADVPPVAPSEARRPGSLADSASSALGLVLGLGTPRRPGSSDGHASRGRISLAVSDGDHDEDDGGLPAGSSARTHAQAAAEAEAGAAPPAGDCRAPKRERDDDADDVGGLADVGVDDACGGQAMGVPPALPPGPEAADEDEDEDEDDVVAPPAARRVCVAPSCSGTCAPERHTGAAPPLAHVASGDAGQAFSSASSVVATTRWRVPARASEPAEPRGRTPPSAAVPGAAAPLPQLALGPNTTTPAAAADAAPPAPRLLTEADSSALLERIALQDAVLVRQSKHIAALYADMRRMRQAVEALAGRRG